MEFQRCFLKGLNLGPALRKPDTVRGLDFVRDSNMTSEWLVVKPRDEVTLSLLQQRLNDLGTGIRIVTGYGV